MAIGSPQWMYASGEAYTIDQGLKFEDGRSTYLTKTPTTTSNRKTWTFSTWLKLGNLGANRNIFGAGSNYDEYTVVFIRGDGKLQFGDKDSGADRYWQSDMVFRDTSAWYHLLIAVDTTQGTDTNRLKIYVNGSQITLNNTNGQYSSSEDTYMNLNTKLNWIGADQAAAADYDGYLAEVNFIDGQALTPADFGETGDYGEWKPKEYSGTYGTNGFYLPFKNDYTVEGFSTVIYKGNATNRYIGGTGFKPDLTWIKKRDSGEHHILMTPLVSTSNLLATNITNAEQSLGTTFSTSTDGFSLGSDSNGYVNSNGNKFVAWNWDMGADTPTGFGAVTYTGSGADQSISGFGFSPDLVWAKKRGATGHHFIFDTVRGTNKQLKTSNTGAETTHANYLEVFEPDGFRLGSDSDTNASGTTHIAWGWDMGNTTATNTSGSITSTVRANPTYGQSIVKYGIGGSYPSTPSVGHGLSSAPEFILTKRLDNGTGNWGGYHASLGNGKKINLNLTSASADTNQWADTTPSSSLFYLPNDGDAETIETNTNYIAYCFHSVTGYSKFGSWVGNANDTAPVITTGFAPAFVMYKKATGVANWIIVDNTRNPLGIKNKVLYPDSTAVEYSSPDAGQALIFTSTGFQPGGAGGDMNGNNETYIYMAFAGGMDSISDYNTTGSIDSRVKANPTYGQSIVSYTGNGSSGATIGHGLSSAPEMVIVKSRDGTNNDNWGVGHTSIGWTKALRLNLTDAEDTNSNFWNNTAPSSTLVTLGNGSQHNSNTEDYIAYCWHSVTGYSKFGSYTGNGNATGPSVTCGFKPAFVMFKNASSAGNLWAMYDNTRNPTNRANLSLAANSSDAEANYPVVDFDSNGFQIHGTYGFANDNGDTYIYMAFADKREYAYWLDQSGNNNDWTSNNLTESDISVDSPTNNFATLNPLITNQNSAVYSEGNLDWKSNTSGGQDTTTGSTIAVSTGKWYFEWFAKASSRTSDWMFGVAEDINELNRTSKYLGEAGNSYGYYPYDGDVYVGSGSNVSNYGSQADNIDYTGTVFSLAVDFDAGKMWVAHNGVWKNSGNPSAGTGHASITTGLTYSIAVSMASAGSNWVNYVANFGQDSSFAGNKTAQGNQDGNSIGDFYYTPPTGFLALCTSNLPDVAVVPSEHFNTVLWTGNGADDRSITGVGFQPDWVWGKGRSNGGSHRIADAVRGATKLLMADDTGAEYTSNAVKTFISDGFTTSRTGGNLNDNNWTFVAWNWNCPDTFTPTVTSGLTSASGRSNAAAGFSIVKVTADSNISNSSSYTHNLGVAPEMIIQRRIDGSDNWNTYHKDLGGAGKFIELNTTNAVQDASNVFEETPTSTVVKPCTNIIVNGATHIFYNFASVDGYSKVGSYTGNDNADGTFVYCGFKPAFVLIKNTVTSGEGFVMFNNKSDPTNVVGTYLTAYGSTAEQGTAGTTSSRSMDFTSNGFKLRGNSTEINDGEIHIFYAVAETPFKYSNAR